MSEKFQDYTHHPEFGLEWEKWLATPEGRNFAMMSQVDPKGKDWIFMRIAGIKFCLSAMLARRDKEIEGYKREDAGSVVQTLRRLEIIDRSQES